MQDYFAFGGCLRSDLEFPDLSSHPPVETPDWVIQLSDAPPTEPGELKGERVLDPAWALRLYRLSQGWRLEYGATGSYEVFERGRRIIWHRGADRRGEVVRAVILGPIMALALHESGVLCLHGSSVAVEGRGIGFLAPKGHGKSTLAGAITAAGGRLMSDDLLAVTTSETPEVLPGVHSIRTHRDVTELILEKFPGALLRDGWKDTLTNIPEHRLGWDRVPLDALYLISPGFEPSSQDEVERTQMKPMEAALALATHTKITDLLSHLEEGTMLRWIGGVVSRIPVYRLEVPRNLDRLSSAAARVLAWHGKVTG